MRSGRTLVPFAFIFLLVAIMAGGLGFTGIAGTAVWIANVLFVVFMLLFLASVVFRRRRS